MLYFVSFYENSYALQVTRYTLRVTGYKLRVTSYALRKIAAGFQFVLSHLLCLQG